MTDSIQAETPRLSVMFEPPDITMVTWNGTLLPEDIALLGRISDTIRGGGVAETYMLVDMRRGESITAAARKQITDLSRRKYWKAQLCFGASFKTKVLIELITNALKLVIPDFKPTIFVDSEVEARARIAQLRLEGV